MSNERKTKSEQRRKNMPEEQKNSDAVFEALIRVARQNGAGDAKAVSTTDVVVEASLAQYCEDSGCENFGLSVNCPPHTSGPAGFKELLKEYTHAVVFKIDVPIETLVSDEKHDVFRLLHKIGANIEKAAIKRGYNGSKAFAGESCKVLFCQKHDDCLVISGKGECRHPNIARPSMSGFGINVSELMKTAGWQMDRITSETDPDAVTMGMVCGLVLIGDRD